MIDIKVENVSSVEEIRITLKQLLKLPPTKQAEYNFDWLIPIVKNSLDHTVILYLNKNQPVINAFITLDLNEHMNEAKNLINNSISIRNEIFGLETQALMSAIEYVQIINSLESDKELSELNLTATFKQSEEPNIDDYKTALSKKFDNIKLSLKTKFSLHNQSGNPLNYGERVKYLRQIYCDNIKNIYERLIAVKRTLKYSCNQDTNPLPNYIEISNNLNELVWWMRDAIYDFEIKSQYDYIIQRTISLAEICKARGLDIDASFKKFADDNFIDLQILAIDFGIDETNEKPRILGLSVNVVGRYDGIEEDPKKVEEQARTYAHRANYEPFREQLRFRCEINPPEQRPTLDPDFLFVKPKDEDIAQFNAGGVPIHFGPTLNVAETIKFPDKLIVGDLQSIFKTSVNTNLNFLAENCIKNASPFGKWRIHLKYGVSPRVSSNGDARLDETTVGILDVALTFRLAVRKY